MSSDDGALKVAAMHFALRSPLRRIVPLAAAHGMTDFGSPALLAPYGMLFLPLPGWMCTTLFSAASVLHFAEDGMPHPSSLVRCAEPRYVRMQLVWP